jgi:hypothetical protein
MLKTLFATVALCALGAGCAHPRLHVVGDRPAEIYVQAEKGSITESVKKALSLGPESHYVGRTTPGGDVEAPVAPAPNAQAGQPVYSFFYKVPGHPERVIVEIKSAERTWEYTVYFDQDKEMTVYYPKVGEEAPVTAKAAPAPGSEPQPGKPQPAGVPRGGAPSDSR